MISRLVDDLRAEASIRGPRRLLWLAGASCAGVLSGLCIGAGDLLALGWAVGLCAGVAVLAVSTSNGLRSRQLLAVALCAATLHMAVAIGIQSFAPTFSGGFITGDDASYYRLASQSARYLQGAPLDPTYSPPLWGGDAYLFGAFVYLETGLFLVFGPDARIPILLNSALAIVTSILIFDLTTRLFGSRAGLMAAAIVALFPSLILWSALNLKDSPTITLAVLAIWAVVRFQLHPRAVYFLLPFAAGEALITLRSYVAATIAIAALASIALVTMPPLRRAVAVALAGVLTVVIVIQSLNAIGSGIGEQLLLAFEHERAGMAVGARTGFVSTPSPTLNPPATAVVAVAPHPDEVAQVPGRTLSYLPIGLSYALFAPFPLAARRLQELAAAPEMVGWYLLVVAGFATLWRERRRWLYLSPIVLAIGGLMVVLALAEGNVGTLFRHRAMVVPFAAALASPSLIAAWAVLSRRSAHGTVQANHQDPPSN